MFVKKGSWVAIDIIKFPSTKALSAFTSIYDTSDIMTDYHLRLGQGAAITTFIQTNEEFYGDNKVITLAYKLKTQYKFFSIQTDVAKKCFRSLPKVVQKRVQQGLNKKFNDLVLN